MPECDMMTFLPSWGLLFAAQVGLYATPSYVKQDTRDCKYLPFIEEVYAVWQEEVIHRQDSPTSVLPIPHYTSRSVAPQVTRISRSTWQPQRTAQHGDKSYAMTHRWGKAYTLEERAEGLPSVYPDVAIAFIADTGVKLWDPVKVVKLMKATAEAPHRGDTSNFIALYASCTNSIPSEIDIQFKRAISAESIHVLNKQRGEVPEYSSEVMVVEIQCNRTEREIEKWVCKVGHLPEKGSKDAYTHDWNSMVGELASYELSKMLRMNLVPPTRLIWYMDTSGLRIGTAKPLLDGLYRDYKVLDGPSDHLRVQLTRVFAFITGQCDLRRGNICLGQNGEPILLDNECTFEDFPNVIRANDWGNLPHEGAYWNIGAVGHVPDIGSQKKPLLLDNTQLAQLMGLDASDECFETKLSRFVISEEKTCRHHRIIIQQGNVYRYYPTPKTLYEHECLPETIEIVETWRECLMGRYDHLVQLIEDQISLLTNAVYTLESFPLSTDKKAHSRMIPEVEDAEKVANELRKQAEAIVEGIEKRLISFLTQANRRNPQYA